MNFGYNLCFVIIFSVACNSSESYNSTVTESKNIETSYSLDSPTELTPTQESAFDALNTIQVSTHQKNRFYSTFAGVARPCQPDTTVTISQSEFLVAMEVFLDQNCPQMKLDERSQLANRAVSAQGEYTLSICYDRRVNISFEDGYPRSGIWVLHQVLGRRDVVMIW